MDSWLVYALAFPALFAVVNIIDDNFLRNVYRSPYFGAIISGFFGLFPLVGLIFLPLTIAGPLVILAGMIAGFMTVFYYLFYFKGLEGEYPSVVIALFNLTPIFTLILAYFLLNESLKLQQIFGFLLILMASIAISVSQISLKKVTFSKGLIPVIIASFIYACVGILTKFVYLQVDFFSGYVYFSCGMGLGAFWISLVSSSGRRFYSEFKSKFKKYFLIFILIEIIGLSAELANNLAISKGPVSLVKVVEGFQPLYILLYSLLLFPFIPRFFREANDNKIIKKILCMVTMLLGLYLISS